jgi:biopolymer transport protein ExbD
MKTGKRSTLFDEINITPLTDIFLVLLIIMMVVAPMMQETRADIKPPGITTGKSVSQGILTVEVTAKGEYFVNGSATQEADLTNVLTENKAKATEKNVLIRADKTTKSAAVLKVLEAAKNAQYEKVTVAGQSLSQSRQDALSSATTTSGMTQDATATTAPSTETGN